MDSTQKGIQKGTKQKQQQTYETTTTTIIKTIAAYKFHSYQMNKQL